MRTFGLSLGVAVSAASLLAPSQLLAQQNLLRSDDYSLAIVSAVMPSEAAHAASDVVTLVIENRGTIEAPVSMVSVAPRNHLSLARETAIPALAPGQRATIQLPVATTADGAQCVSITISPAPVADPAIARFLAAAIPDPHIRLGSSGELAGAVAQREMPWSESTDLFASFWSPAGW